MVGAYSIQASSRRNACAGNRSGTWSPGGQPPALSVQRVPKSQRTKPCVPTIMRSPRPDVRAEALRSVGPLDESYFAYHEEVDWCFRARAAGWRIYYQPFSRVWHHFSKSTDVRRPPSSRKWNRSRGEELPNPLPVAWNPVRTYLGARNSVRFVRAHGAVLQKLRFVLSTLEMREAASERRRRTSPRTTSLPRSATYRFTSALASRK